MLLKENGWLINKDKSFTDLSQDRTFIEGQFLTSQNLVMLPYERGQALKACIRMFVARPWAPARDFLVILGLMAACLKVVHMANLHMRPIQLYLMCTNVAIV